MSTLSTCSSCAGFVPAAATACPHCDARVTWSPPLLARLSRGVLGIAGGSTIALTLMACYGAPPCDDDEDRDGDNYGNTYCGYGEDCDDGDENIYPGAPDDEGDGVDQNCDGEDGIAGNDDGGVSDGGDADGDAGVSAADGGE